MAEKTITLSPELKTAISLAKTAGEAIVAARSKLHIQFKQGSELVTQADLEADTIIQQGILAAWPEHAILSEELAPNANMQAEHLWIVDPIDGTVNYAHHHPNVAISIAYYHLGKAQAAVVYNPFLNELFYAQKGAGAWLNEQPIYCSKTFELKRALIATGFPYVKHDLAILIRRLHSILSQCADVRRLGSAALDICWVACGRIDAYYENVKPWDFAAAQLIAREAGAIVSHVHPLDPTDNPEFCSQDLLISAPALFNPLQQLLRQADNELR